MDARCRGLVQHDHCPPCERLEQTVFNQPHVAQAISRNYIPFKVHAGLQARVAEPSRFLLIQAAVFRAAVETDPLLAQAVIGSLAGQFRRMVRQIKNLKLRPSVQRVGCYVLALSKRQGTPNRAILPLEKTLIASELGITRESFSRALSSLEKSGIRVEGQTIAILDGSRLARQCMPDPLIDGADDPVNV